MLAKAIGILDFLPGYKANTGAIVLVLTTIMQLVGANQPLIDLVKEIATALLVYGVAMKNVRQVEKK